MRRSILFVLLSAAALAGCQSPSAPDATPAADASTPTTPETPAAPASPTVPTGADDTCGAASYAWLIGENRSKIPATPPGKTVRVLCTTCPMTMDFNAGRVNIVYDEKSGIVGRIGCG
jgi:hypothetical protein